MTQNGGCVLIVDDDSNVIRALHRYLKSDFPCVLTADSPAQAEQILDAHAVTHLVCDFDLGARWPNGVQLIEGWRSRYPSIERALLYTGSPTANLDEAPHVDRVLSKSTDLNKLLVELHNLPQPDMLN